MAHPDNKDTGPVLEQEMSSALKNLKQAVEFRVDFLKKPLEYQKNFFNSLMVLREERGESFVPYTKDSLLQMQDMAHACEVLLAMNMRDSILSEAKQDPSWVIAPYSEEQLRNIDPIYATKTLLSLNARNGYLKHHGSGDKNIQEIGELFTQHPYNAYQDLIKKPV